MDVWCVGEMTFEVVHKQQTYLCHNPGDGATSMRGRTNTSSE